MEIDLTFQRSEVLKSKEGPQRQQEEQLRDRQLFLETGSFPYQSSAVSLVCTNTTNTSNTSNTSNTTITSNISNASNETSTSNATNTSNNKQYNSLFLLPLDCRERCAWFIQNLPSALTPPVKSNSSLSAPPVQCLTCSKSVQKCQRPTISR